ncbi:hypothetical protein JAAARDRAFT_302707 [Jaapia argillacea MUCL 33604]|uniref:Uncharacterized protein n=1 Tax=Jaapia argillacea MUCL 33604 TaxID=933084 RepID=A0A067PPW1_9AGAM|nr:hypothetical protein JAAARDRAFT_302707 [Jaapia argillacea MUCL 33604]
MYGLVISFNLRSYQRNSNVRQDIQEKKWQTNMGNNSTGMFTMSPPSLVIVSDVEKFPCRLHVRLISPCSMKRSSEMAPGVLHPSCATCESQWISVRAGGVMLPAPPGRHCNMTSIKAAGPGKLPELVGEGGKVLLSSEELDGAEANESTTERLGKPGRTECVGLASRRTPASKPARISSRS